MGKIDILEKQKFIFARLFLLPNKFQAGWNRIFDGEMTLRRWLLTLAVARYGSAFPTLGEVAELMGSSHQNVKQLALKLEKGGFLNIVKDEKDLRVIHLTLTDKSCIFWEKRQGEINLYFAELFKDLSEEDINFLYGCINKLYESVLKIEKIL